MSKCFSSSRNTAASDAHASNAAAVASQAASLDHYIIKSLRTTISAI